MKKIQLNFTKERGLIPVIIQEEKSGKILMLGFMSKEAFEKTRETGLVYFWSRSRKKLWLKGEESGNKLQVKRIFLDCDLDALLIQTKVLGRNVCHTGNFSCFYNEME